MFDQLPALDTQLTIPSYLFVASAPTANSCYLRERQFRRTPSRPIRMQIASSLAWDTLVEGDMQMSLITGRGRITRFLSSPSNACGSLLSLGSRHRNPFRRESRANLKGGHSFWLRCHLFVSFI